MRLDEGETGAVVSDVVFLRGGSGGHKDKEEGGGDETSGDEESRHDEDDEEEEDALPQKRRGPGRPRRKARMAAAKVTVAKKNKGKASEVQPGGLEVKLNETAVQGNDGGTWEVQVPPGLSVLEVGEKGGMMWKVYLDRAVY